jgi:hypothetical protein
MHFRLLLAIIFIAALPFLPAYSALWDGKVKKGKAAKI